MRVFCPEHKRSFLTPRQTPIKCENKGHVLGELDFKGDGQPPVELQWQYCCNCEHFCPVDFDQDSLQRCPVCTRRSSMLYLCERCFTVTFESNTPLQVKNFTLTSEGAPHPSCPGCLQPTQTDLHEHTCDELGAFLATALNSCPICQERLDIEPSFPSSVASYLKGTKVANKLNVTFDYETQLFVPVEDGEFVLISNGNEASQPIVLPRSARFATRQDFYEFYQDYFHCAKPDAGEVHVIQPAAVDRVADGWKLEAPGILEVLEDQPKKKASANATRQQIDTSPRKEPEPSIEAVNEESPVTPCTHCGSIVEARYAFCWKCGNPLIPKNNCSVTDCGKPGAIGPSAAITTEDEELTVQHVRPIASSWALGKEPERTSSASGSVLKLTAVALVGLLLVSLGSFVLIRSVSRIPSVTAAQPVPNVQSIPSTAPVKAGVATENTFQRTSSAPVEEDELKKLRERRIRATASAKRTILEAFAAAERKHPNDYRFPYERAKLAIKGSQASSHDDAFNALSLAAERAIKTGKADEMLDGLEEDKADDFHKLAHGHHEWNQLAEALKNKDTSFLSAVKF
jgi:hypothetical protein